jgi:preprotein translocase subunit SecE
MKFRAVIGIQNFVKKLRREMSAVVWPCKYDGLNKDTKRELELNFKEEVPVD